MSAAREPWIESARFDLLAFFAAGVVGLVIPALTVFHVLSPILVVWIYVIAFDGPHMLAGYSRTFFDKQTREQHPRLLYGTLAAGVVIPLGSAILSHVLANDAPFQLFLAVMTLYSFWHIVRQGWGIFALYRSREGERANIRRERAAFYVAMYAPYIYFLFTHPAVRDAVGAKPIAGVLQSTLARGLVLASVLAVFVLVRRLTRAKAVVARAFAFWLIAFHAAIYFALALYEPVFASARGTDQTFMIMTAAVSICHATQYVALVFLHNTRRYRAGASVHGIAAHLSAKAWPFALTCVVFTLFYAALTYATGIYPAHVADVAHATRAAEASSRSGAPVVGAVALDTGFSLTGARVALAIYWGIALQHYLLDARIWRIRTDPALRDVFRAKSEAA